MSYVALVVADSAKAREARLHMVEALHLRNGVPPARARTLAEAHEGAYTPPVGELWTSAELECPLGAPNCRNCGDPAFDETCRAAGHCPNCGVLHGVAPDSVLAAKGLALHPVAPPTSTQRWDRTARRFA